LTKFKATFPGNKKVDVEFDKYTVNTDQKKTYGGDDTAPEPFNIFLSSIASCAGIYAVSFCEIRKLDTSSMFLDLEITIKEGQKYMDEIKLTLHVNKDFPEKYIKAIIKSMNGCAVKGQLHPDIKTSTSVVYLD
jgi:putative redox protein